MKSGRKRNISLETSKFTFRFLENCIFIISVSNKDFQHYQKQDNFVCLIKVLCCLTHKKAFIWQKKVYQDTQALSVAISLPQKDISLAVPSNQRIHVLY